jgi:hypothetical protein
VSTRWPPKRSRSADRQVEPRRWPMAHLASLRARSTAEAGERAPTLPRRRPWQAMEARARELVVSGSSGAMRRHADTRSTSSRRSGECPERHTPPLRSFPLGREPDAGARSFIATPAPPLADRRRSEVARQAVLPAPMTARGDRERSTRDNTLRLRNASDRAWPIRTPPRRTASPTSRVDGSPAATSRGPSDKPVHQERPPALPEGRMPGSRSRSRRHLPEVLCLSTESDVSIVVRWIASPAPSALRVSHPLNGLIPTHPRGSISSHIHP